MKLLKQVLDFIYPPSCGLCGKVQLEYLCQSCAKEIAKGESLRKNRQIKLEKRYFDSHYYLFEYEGIIRKKLIEYKFGDKPYLSKTFVKLLLNSKKLCGFIQRYDIIIPVPIHRKRKAQRGYNQCELILTEMAKEREGLTIAHTVIKKVKDTKKQSSLDKAGRSENVKNGYTIQTREIIQNKRILLFDDIYTTGNTVNEISRILKQVGAKEIMVITIAKD